MAHSSWELEGTWVPFSFELEPADFLDLVWDDVDGEELEFLPFLPIPENAQHDTLNCREKEELLSLSYLTHSFLHMCNDNMNT